MILGQTITTEGPCAVVCDIKPLVEIINQVNYDLYGIYFDSQLKKELSGEGYEAFIKKIDTAHNNAIFNYFKA